MTHLGFSQQHTSIFLMSAHVFERDDISVLVCPPQAPIMNDVIFVYDGETVLRGRGRRNRISKRMRLRV